MQASFSLREICATERWKILFVHCEMGGERQEEMVCIRWAAFRTTIYVTSLTIICLIF